MRSPTMAMAVPRNIRAPRPWTVDRVGDQTLEQNIKHSRGRLGPRETPGELSNRPLPRHLGGSCELRARLMRCFDGSEQRQQRRDPHTSRAQKRVRGRCPIVHLFTSGGLYLSCLGGATLMTHAKFFEVITKLIWCTRGALREEVSVTDGPRRRRLWQGVGRRAQATRPRRHDGRRRALARRRGRAALEAVGVVVHEHNFGN